MSDSRATTTTMKKKKKKIPDPFLNVVWPQGIPRNYSTSKSGHQVWKRVSLLVKEMLFQNAFMKEWIFVASLLALLVENWFVVSEKRGNFYINLISGNWNSCYYRKSNEMSHPKFLVDTFCEKSQSLDECSKSVQIQTTYEVTFYPINKTKQNRS